MGDQNRPKGLNLVDDDDDDDILFKIMLSE
jgi:hypothetical protein